uniref:Uncharacterized protein n=1 Tax=Gasterosteus aculeatus aculeatus TaxID=481459 RepID=G3Q7M4_GASAC
MASANYGPSEDQFLCSICLDVFTDPVTTPCGHNFCINCINEHWNTSNQNRCPMCNKDFITKPDLRVNTMFSEMVVQFRQSAQQKASSSSSEQQESKPGEVPCDVCTGTKVKALKSCLVCLASYCETHLEPHLTASRLKRHQLMDPVENLEGRMCTKHDKPLELFCKSDQTCVCMLCTVLDHKNHDVVPLEEEYEEKKVELKKTEAEMQQMIQKRRVKIQEIKHSVDLMKRGDVNKNLPNNPERFSSWFCVLTKQSFSSGRFYFEVQVEGKTRWYLGVIRESVNRKGIISRSPQDGYWIICLINGNIYYAPDDPSVVLSVKSGPQKVGVFVDYEEGVVSFYDVEAAALVYSFTGCSFTEKLFPFFSPGYYYDGRNSAPLIISPVGVN